jgi:hypothetical protein
LSQGGGAATSVRFEEGRSAFVRREPNGELQEVECEGSIVIDGVARLVRIDVRSDGIDVAQGSRTVRCPGPGELPFAIGLGATGEGSVVASGMRLSRIDE